MSTVKTTYDDPALGGEAIARDQARELLGQVMGYVAVAVGFAALGAYLGRDLSGGDRAGAVHRRVRVHHRTQRRRRQGPRATRDRAAVRAGPAARTRGRARHRRLRRGDPSALWQAAGATAAFVAGCGAYGYATRRDLSAWARTLFWALLGLIVFGIVAIFVSIPNSHIIYAVAGLGIFGAFTIFDFNRLRRASADGAVAIAASIFLDIFNVFLLLLELFGGSRG